MIFCHFNILVEKTKSVFLDADVERELINFIPSLVSIEELVANGSIYTIDTVKISDITSFSAKLVNDRSLAFEITIPSQTPLDQTYMKSLLKSDHGPATFRLIATKEPKIEYIE